jgi:hypothetical protein
MAVVDGAVVQLLDGPAGQVLEARDQRTGEGRWRAGVLSGGSGAMVKPRHHAARAQDGELSPRGRGVQDRPQGDPVADRQAAGLVRADAVQQHGDVETEVQVQDHLAAALVLVAEPGRLPTCPELRLPVRCVDRLDQIGKLGEERIDAGAPAGRYLHSDKAATGMTTNAQAEGDADQTGNRRVGPDTSAHRRPDLPFG